MTKISLFPDITSNIFRRLDDTFGHNNELVGRIEFLGEDVKEEETALRVGDRVIIAPFPNQQTE